jgi:hypothetical protein
VVCLLRFDECVDHLRARRSSSLAKNAGIGKWCAGANLDPFWISAESLEVSDDLEDPDVIAEEIADDLEAALDEFVAIAADLRERGDT